MRRIKVEEKQLNEIMDQSLKKIDQISLRSDGKAKYKFIMPKNTPNINEFPIDIAFEVRFSSCSTSTVKLERQDILKRPQLKALFSLSSLTYNNNISGMDPLTKTNEQGYVELNSSLTSAINHAGYNADDYQDSIFSAFTIYGTIGRILYNYINDTPDRVQGITFSTAHEGLVKPYIILSKEAERKSNLVSAQKYKYNRQSGQSFYLIKGAIISELINILNKKGN